MGSLLIFHYRNSTVKMNVKYLILLSFIVILIPQPVSAYLDPGSGSMVWQMVTAVAFGAAFTVKIYWQKIKIFFNKSKRTNDNSN